MVEIYYNCSINEATSHPTFEIMYGLQPSTLANQLLLQLTGATAEAADRLTMITDIRDVVPQLIRLSKERIAARSTRSVHLFQPGDYV